MKIQHRFTLVVFLILVSLGLALAADFTPQGDINMRGFLSMKNATDLNTSRFCLGNYSNLSSVRCITDLSQVNSSAAASSALLVNLTPGDASFIVSGNATHKNGSVNQTWLHERTLNSTDILNGSNVQEGTVNIAYIDPVVAVDADVTAVQSRIDSVNTSVVNGFASLPNLSVTQVAGIAPNVTLAGQSYLSISGQVITALLIQSSHINLSSLQGFNFSSAIADLQQANRTVNVSAANANAAIADLRSANVTLNTSAINANAAITDLRSANTTLNTSISNANTAISNLQSANITLNTSVTNLRSQVTTISNAFISRINVNTSSNASQLGNNSILTILAGTGIATTHTGGTNPNITISCTVVDTAYNATYETGIANLQTANITLNTSATNANTAIADLRSANTTTNISVKNLMDKVEANGNFSANNASLLRNGTDANHRQFNVSANITLSNPSTANTTALFVLDSNGTKVLHEYWNGSCWIENNTRSGGWFAQC